MQRVTREDVLHCAALAALDLDEAEIEPLRVDMERLLAFAGRLAALDLGGGAGPCLHAAGPPLRRRGDAALPGLGRDEALMNAPEADGGRFAAPKFL
jgi:aspartyl-tRNA(Asn)/glutamyl-tRNA(Gln) amidotransferase subunit C